MMNRRRRLALRKAGVLKTPPLEIGLFLPPQKKFAGKDFAAPVVGLLLLAALLYGGDKFRTWRLELRDEIEIVEVEAPPLPVEIKEPPKPPPPPPSDPDVTPPPVAETPPPVFGLQEDALGKGGDFAVATGNTLMKAADSVVQTAPPPLPAAPVILDQPANQIDTVMGIYPAWAQEQGIEGRVSMIVTIDAEGRVVDIKVKKSAGRDFDKSAVEALQATHFKPQIRNGVKVSATFLYVYDFILE